MKKSVFALFLALISATAIGAEVKEPLDGWTFDFTAAKNQCDKEHRDMVIATYSPYCGHCIRARKAFNTEVFRDFAKKRNLLLVETYTTKTNSLPSQAEGVNFVKKSRFLEKRQMPYVTYYHPADLTNEAFQLSFTGRRGAANGAQGDTLAEIFINAIDNIFQQRENILADKEKKNE